MPTVLELLGIEAPATFQGRDQLPVHGTSLAYTFDQPADQPDPPTRKESQYYEVEGQRAFIAGDWKIVSYRLDGVRYDAAPWRLYNIARDPSERQDLAKSRPEVLARLAAGWDAAAARYSVLPVNDNPLLNRAPWAPPPEIARRTRFEFAPTADSIERPRQPRPHDARSQAPVAEHLLAAQQQQALLLRGAEEDPTHGRHAVIADEFHPG